MDSVPLHILKPKEVDDLLVFLRTEAKSWAPEGLNKGYLLAAARHSFINVRYSSIRQRFDDVFYEFSSNECVIAEDWYSSGIGYEETIDALLQIHSGKLLLLGFNDKATGAARGWEMVDSPREIKLFIPDDFVGETLPTFTKQHAHSVVDLLSEEWWTPEQARDFVETSLQIEHSHSKVILESNKAIAFAHSLVDGDRAWTDVVYVARSARGKGYGEKLVRSLISDCKSKSVQTVFLGVDESNTAAIALYQGLGFKFTSFRKFQFRVR